MWEMILAGRYMMIPIAIASLVGMTVIIERILVLRQGRIVRPEIASAVETLSASPDLSTAYATCDRHPGPFANIVRAGLDHADNDWTIIRDVLEEAGRQEATRLTRRLGILETVAAVSPLLGLLGTVLGMIRVFATISLAGLGNPETLSSGISEAMVTTAAGLIIHAVTPRSVARASTANEAVVADPPLLTLAVSPQFLTRHEEDPPAG